MPRTTDEPHLVDVHVGQRIRVRRKLQGLSQTELATACKVTFQQVQKYERGYNRVSASKLYEIAQALDAPLNFFFEGLPDTRSDADQTFQCLPEAVMVLASAPGGLLLAEAFVGAGSAGRSALVAVANFAKLAAHAEAV